MWWPGNGQDPGGFPLQVRFAVSAGADYNSQVDGNFAALGGRGIAVPGENLAFELQHPWLVQLEDFRTVGPGQPVAARVQPRGQDHHLPYPGFGSLAEVVVEVPGSGALEVHEVPTELGLQLVVGSLAVQQVRPFATDGPAEDLGIGIDGQGLGFLRLQCSCGGYE